jgi:excisionase family DNA binding protein
VETTQAPSTLLTIDEAASMLRVGRTTIFRLVAEGELMSIKVGRRRLVPTASLDDFVERATGRGNGSA